MHNPYWEVIFSSIIVSTLSVVYIVFQHKLCQGWKLLLLLAVASLVCIFTLMGWVCLVNLDVLSGVVFRNHQLIGNQSAETFIL